MWFTHVLVCFLLCTIVKGNPRGLPHGYEAGKSGCKDIKHILDGEGSCSSKKEKLRQQECDIIQCMENTGDSSDNTFTIWVECNKKQCGTYEKCTDEDEECSSICTSQCQDAKPSTVKSSEDAIDVEVGSTTNMMRKNPASKNQLTAVYVLVVLIIVVIIILVLAFLFYRRRNSNNNLQNDVFVLPENNNAVAFRALSESVTEAEYSEIPADLGASSKTESSPYSTLNDTKRQDDPHEYGQLKSHASPALNYSHITMPSAQRTDNTYSHIATASGAAETTSSNQPPLGKLNNEPDTKPDSDYNHLDHSTGKPKHDTQPNDDNEEDPDYNHLENSTFGPKHEKQPAVNKDDEYSHIGDTSELKGTTPERRSVYEDNDGADANDAGSGPSSKEVPYDEDTETEATAGEYFILEKHDREPEPSVDDNGSDGHDYFTLEKDDLEKDQEDNGAEILVHDYFKLEKQN